MEIIQLLRKDRNYPLSGISTINLNSIKNAKDKNKVKLFIQFIKRFSGKNFKLDKKSTIPFNTIDMFCYSNDLDSNKPLCITYINDYNIEIEQSNNIDDDIINLNDEIITNK